MTWLALLLVTALIGLVVSSVRGSRPWGLLTPITVVIGVCLVSVIIAVNTRRRKRA